MEPSKTQSLALFTYSKIDFRDKFEEVSENFHFFPHFFVKKFPSHIFYFAT